MFEEDLKTARKGMEFVSSCVESTCGDIEFDSDELSAALGHYKRALDRATMRCYKAMCQSQNLQFKKNHNCYFPYGSNRGTFDGRISKVLPLAKNKFPEVYEAFASIQPHKCSNDWVVKLCKQRNVSEHSIDDLTERASAVEIDAPGIFNCGMGRMPGFQFAGNEFNGKALDNVFVDDNGYARIEKREGGVNVRSKILVGLVEADEELIYFMERAGHGVVDFLTRLERSF